MEDALKEITDLFKGRFLMDASVIRQRLFRVKAFVFDWDGVFNAGVKDVDGSSPFSEVDAMGTNLLRFNHYLLNDKPPITAIITGEKNKAALSFARREHFNEIYCGVKHKADALQHLCNEYQVMPDEVAFVFDDVLDFSAAAICGLRMMVYRDCNPLMLQFVEKRQLADYITAADGSNYALREVSELLTGISGKYEQTMSQRMAFTEQYQQYLKMRNEADTVLYVSHHSKITKQHSL